MYFAIPNTVERDACKDTQVGQAKEYQWTASLDEFDWNASLVLR